MAEARGARRVPLPETEAGTPSRQTDRLLQNGAWLAAPRAQRTLSPRVVLPSYLLAIHAKLDQHFLLHQELLLERRLSRAAHALSRYVRLLDVHMRHEEELLLPIYAREPPPPRWPLVLYTGQHQRMRELLLSVTERLTALTQREIVRGRDIIELLDHERTYKHLAEHHDGAEREGFFPALDRLMEPPEQASIVERCWNEWLSAERAE